MHNKHQRTFVIASALALLLLSACGSSSDILGGGGASDNLSELRGTVDQVDTRDQSILLTNVENYNSRLMNGGNSVRVYYDNRTNVTYQGQSYRPEDLERGDQISVRLDNSGSRLLAESMTVLYDASGGSSYPSSSGTYASNVRGTVRYVDTSRRTIEVDRGYNGGTAVVEYDSSTPVTYNGQRYSPADLENGDEIDIAVRNVSGRLVADSINVVRNVASSGGSYGTYGARSVRGTVRYVDTGRRTIELEQATWSSNFTTNTGSTVTVQYDSGTTVEYQGRTYDVSNLERGDVVDVYISDTSSRSYYSADRIVVVRDVNSF